jgi:hypothetical protein
MKEMLQECFPRTIGFHSIIFLVSFDSSVISSQEILGDWGATSADAEKICMPIINP